MIFSIRQIGLNVGDKVFIPKEITNNFGPPEGVRKTVNPGGES